MRKPDFDWQKITRVEVNKLDWLYFTQLVVLDCSSDEITLIEQVLDD